MPIARNSQQDSAEAIEAANFPRLDAAGARSSSSSAQFHPDLDPRFTRKRTCYPKTEVVVKVK